MQASKHVLLHLVDAAVAAGGQAVAGGIDPVDHVIEIARPVAHHMKNRPENFAFELVHGIQLVGARGEPETLAHAGRIGNAGNRPRLALHAFGMLFKHFELIAVDDRTDVRIEHTRPAHYQLPHGAGEHLQHVVSHVALQIQHAQRRTALAGRQEGRMNDVRHHLFG